MTTRIVDIQGFGHGALVGFLKGNDVDVLLGGGIGADAQSALQGIELYAGLSGLADDTASCLMAGILEKSTMSVCDHHHRHNGGGCHHAHGHAHGECQGSC